MPSAGAAPATTPAKVVVGPLTTQGGFQYWYLACFPDCIIAVRQGIGAFFALGLSSSAGHAFGLLGALINYLAQKKAKVFRERTEATLKSTPSTRLCSKPNVVFRASELQVISYKFKKGAPLILSDLTVETTTGSKQRYGINPVDFEKIQAQLQQMYPIQTNSN